MTPTEKDSNQDVRISKLEQWRDDFKDTFTTHVRNFEKFTSNDFVHLEAKVDKILWMVVASIGVPILWTIIKELFLN